MFISSFNPIRQYRISVREILNPISGPFISPKKQLEGVAGWWVVVVRIQLPISIHIIHIHYINQQTMRNGL